MPFRERHFRTRALGPISRELSTRMKPRICICCGEPMTESLASLSRNPNVCSSCSSLVDGMDEGSFSKDALNPQLHSFGPEPAGQTETEQTAAVATRANGDSL